VPQRPTAGDANECTVSKMMIAFNVTTVNQTVVALNTIIIIIIIITIIILAFVQLLPTSSLLSLNITSRSSRRVQTVAKTFISYPNSSWIRMLQALPNRSKRSGFCDCELDDFATQCSTSDKQSYNRILNQPEHVLHVLLPSPGASQYNLRNRPHNTLLCQCASRLTDCNFITRMLYCDMY